MMAQRDDELRKEIEKMFKPYKGVGISPPKMSLPQAELKGRQDREKEIVEEIDFMLNTEDWDGSDWHDNRTLEELKRRILGGKK